ncbi:MAG: hypothetical protein IPI46_08560 [Bacteroidetes bacterium]|nr:hypothetical protein [Bacteroidota bacterium]
METTPLWQKILFLTGILSTIFGAFDPMEGSILIAIGGISLAIVTWLNDDKHKKYFMLSAALIMIGIFFLWFFSALGGIGKGSKYSIWWAITMIPYPIGWVMNIVLLVKRWMILRKA